MPIELAAEELAFWQVALAVGAVVIIAVIALLGLLLYLVGAIESGAQKLLAVAAGVASNTSSIKVALDVADTLDDVAAEAGRHAQLLGVGAR
jgi:Kef-type K+ transport system membrane component KefB